MPRYRAPIPRKPKACCDCGQTFMANIGGHVRCYPCGGGPGDKLRAKARRLVAKAVRTHELPPAGSLVCADCGNRASVYDHRDYSKPLEVEAVCRRCNRQRGQGLIPASLIPRHIQPSESLSAVSHLPHHAFPVHVPDGKDPLRHSHDSGDVRGVAERLK